MVVDIKKNRKNGKPEHYTESVIESAQEKMNHTMCF